MNHLLAISVGPVQELIAAARRTRDLWFGSYLLSEVSRAVAETVECQGTLIFPSSSDAANVANVILAEVADADPRQTAAVAKDAAQRRWLEFAEQARNTASSVIRDDIWAEQVGDVIEFYAAWAPRTDNYPLDRARVMRLLAGRKNCRDFLPAKGRAGESKSSLDGQRESVLNRGDREEWPPGLRISKGEQLDVVGLTKRLGTKSGDGDPRYPSVARVAADTWLRGVDAAGKLQRLSDACQKLARLNRVRESAFERFPYEGTVIYKSRHADLRDELKLAENDLDEVAAVLKDMGGEPNPYVAVLIADGDKMGETISRLDSPMAHREFSEALAGFATEAEQITGDHKGVLIYAGGDDVLAFSPVDKCLGCARKLHDQFGERLKKYKNQEGKTPTLSVGIAIGHFMENMEDLLNYARVAESAAKHPDRDGLAVHLHKRGGAPVAVRGKWSDRTPLDLRLTELAKLFNEDMIPGKLPYELRSMARLYESWPESDVNAAIQADLMRLIAKKQSRGVETVAERMAPFIIDMTANKLLDLAHELLVARLLATALRQATGVAP